MTGVEYRFGKLVFQPSLLPSLAAVLLFGLLLSLGFWQLDRADEKRATDEKVKAAVAKEPLDLNRSDSKQLTDNIFRKITAVGQFLADKQFLLDNRTYKGIPGYHVITPFRFEDKYRSNVILVNRGWIKYTGTRDNIPDISVGIDERTLQGSLKAIGKAIVLKQDDPLQKDMSINPTLIQSVDIAAIENKLAQNIVPVLIRMDSSNKDGFVRDWQPYYGSVDKHLAYATQWFAMAAILVFLYFRLSTKKTESLSQT